MQKLMLAGAGALAKRMALAAGFAVLAVSPAMAQVRVVDQSNADYVPSTPGEISTSDISAPIGPNSPIGQTFTPTLTGLNFASFRAANRFTNSPITLNVSVYTGSNKYDAANLLATSQSVDIAGRSNPTDLNFLFDSIVNLTPGSLYSLIVNDVTYNKTGIKDDADIFRGASYTNGSAILFGSTTFNPSDDFIFSEGLLLASSAVPEPATWAMMIAGFGAIGVAMRRRRRTVSVRFA